VNLCIYGKAEALVNLIYGGVSVHSVGLRSVMRNMNKYTFVKLSFFIFFVFLLKLTVFHSLILANKRVPKIPSSDSFSCRSENLKNQF
jgi:hypothetical protein